MKDIEKKRKWMIDFDEITNQQWLIRLSPE